MAIPATGRMANESRLVPQRIGGTAPDDIMQVACLGRPIYLGMLYDCRNDCPVSGITLWDKDTIATNRHIAKHEFVKFGVETDDSFDRKSSLLDVGASIKMSLFSGMVDVGGSGDYLNDKSTSNYEARVTMWYACQTFFEQMTMDQLAISKIEHKEVFCSDTATHVVTGVEYGARAFLMFKHKASNSANKGDIEASLKTAIGKAQADANSKKSNYAADMDTHFACTYHGDVMLDRNPTTFEEAVLIYQSLPELIKRQTDGDIFGVPQKIHLYPLRKLDNRAPGLKCEIAISLVNECAKFMSGWEQLIVESDDMIADGGFAGLPGQVDSLVQFRRNVSTYLSGFQAEMAALITQIRGGCEKESVLATKFEGVKRSIMYPGLLNEWLAAKNHEKVIIDQLLKLVPLNYAFRPSELTKFVHDRSYHYVLAITFGRVTARDSDLFIAYVDDFLSGEGDGPVAIADGQNALETAWFLDDGVVTPLRCRLTQFYDFYKSTTDKGKNATSTCFVVTADRGRGASRVEPGTITLYERGVPKIFNIPVMRQGPQIVASGCSAEYPFVDLKWCAADEGNEFVVAYDIYYRYDSKDISDVIYFSQRFSNCKGRVLRVPPDADIQFALAPVTNVGRGSLSPFSSSVTTVAPSYAAELVEKGKVDLVIPPESDNVGSASNPTWYKLIKKTTYHDPENDLRVCEINARPGMNVTQRTMIVVGATGAGKTTLVNSLVNFIFGIRRSDAYRLLLIDQESRESQAKSQTKEMTAYVINWHPKLRINYTLTIIDTQGYGHTKGIEADKRITKQVKNFFETTSSGVDSVHAVCFVASASQPRLTHAQKYIFDSILSIFGKNVEHSIIPLLTFADGHRPQILTAIEDYGIIPHDLYFKFNNSVFTPSPKPTGPDAALEANQFSEIFWQMATSNLKQFLIKLDGMNAVSLTLTRENLEKRHRLEIKLKGYRRHIGSALHMLSQMDQDLPLLKGFDDEARQTRDHTKLMNISRKVRAPVTYTGYASNCNNCSETCHENCNVKPGGLLFGMWWCKAMGWKGNCNVCNYPSNEHSSQKYSWEWKVFEEERTDDELRSKYNDAIEGLSMQTNMFIGLMRQYCEVEQKLLDDIKEVVAINKRLNEIALRPDPLAAVDYIDLMIASTERDRHRNPLWKEHVEQLQQARKKAEQFEAMVGKGIKDSASHDLGSFEENFTRKLQEAGLSMEYISEILRADPAELQETIRQHIQKEGNDHDEHHSSTESDHASFCDE